MKKRLLLVDDQTFNLHILTKILQEEYELNLAQTGEQCITLSKKILPDLILLDIVMPGLDGYTTCKELKSSPETQHIPIIFLTAKTDPQDIIKAFALGGVDYVTKDFNPCVLKARIHTHITLAAQSEALKTLSNTDSLTGLSNRKYFEEFLARQWQICATEQKALSLILFDIDYFKEYNDNYGHAQGDKILKILGQTLQELIPKTVLQAPCRYGGEEFALIMSQAAHTEVYKNADLIRTTIEQKGLPHTASKTCDHITLSIGISTLTPNSQSSPTELIELADKALYKAKESGRNCIISLNELSSPQQKDSKN